MRLAQPALRPAINREMLLGLRVTIFEAANRYSLSGNVPAARDRFESFRSSQGVLRHAVQREGTTRVPHLRQFLDDEILRLAFDLHAWAQIGPSLRQQP